MTFHREDMQWWAGAFGSFCVGLMGAVSVPHPYDKWVMALGGGCLAFSMFQITPPMNG